MLTPEWVLAGSFWIHMAATIVWIGGLFFQAVVLNPSLAQSRHPEIWPDVLRAMRRRFEPLAWLSLGLLIATGLVQMEASPNYQGFLTIGSSWAVAILLKHVAVAGMVVAAGYQTWFIQPQLERNLLAKAKGVGSPDLADAAVRRLNNLNRLNLILGLIVLGLTAVARTS
jgi:uncharacterized membrane protein